ncbi:glycosyltransferase family 4 protein [Chloroflexota bacterium]
MKIALVSPYDFAFPGGVNSHISSLERYLTRMGNKVKVIAPSSTEIANLGERFIPIGKPHSIPSSGSIIRIPISLRLASSIKEVLDREKFDIIHLHEPFMPMLCSAILRFSNATNIGTFHAFDGKPGYNWGRPVTSWMIRRRIRKLHGRIAVSNMAMSYAYKYIPGHYDIIPNGIDTEFFSPDVSPLEKYSDGKKNILFFGRHRERRKGLIYLIKAFYDVKQAIPDSRLIIAGGGGEFRKSYEKWIKDHGLENDVMFLGYCAEEDKPRLFKTADIYCSPATSHESFGIVLLEGMAVGTTVVASNIDGYNSVITHNVDGMLVPARDTASLARTLITVLKNKELQDRLSSASVEAAQKYSWEKLSQKVYDLYTEAIKKRPAQA